VIFTHLLDGAARFDFFVLSPPAMPPPPEHYLLVLVDTSTPTPCFDVRIADSKRTGETIVEKHHLLVRRLVARGITSLDALEREYRHGGWSCSRPDANRLCVAATSHRIQLQFDSLCSQFCAIVQPSIDAVDDRHTPSFHDPPCTMQILQRKTPPVAHSTRGDSGDGDGDGGCAVFVAFPVVEDRESIVLFNRDEYEVRVSMTLPRREHDYLCFGHFMKHHGFAMNDLSATPIVGGAASSVEHSRRDVLLATPYAAIDTFLATLDTWQRRQQNARMFNGDSFALSPTHTRAWYTFLHHYPQHLPHARPSLADAVFCVWLHTSLSVTTAAAVLQDASLCAAKGVRFTSQQAAHMT